MRSEFAALSRARSMFGSAVANRWPARANLKPAAFERHSQSRPARPWRTNDQLLTSRECGKYFAAPPRGCRFELFFQCKLFAPTECMYAGSTGSEKQICLQESLSLFLDRSRHRRPRHGLDPFLPLAGKPQHGNARKTRAHPET